MVPDFDFSCILWYQMAQMEMQRCVISIVFFWEFSFPFIYIIMCRGEYGASDRECMLNFG